MNARVALLVAAAVSVAAAACSYKFDNPAEKIRLGEIRGKVVGEVAGKPGQLEPLARVSATLRGVPMPIVSKPTGLFAFYDLPAGLYQLTLRQPASAGIETQALVRTVEIKTTKTGESEGVYLDKVVVRFTGALAGVVQDAQGQPLANAVVVDDTTGVTTTTDANGRYKLEALPVGPHALRAFSDPKGASLQVGALGEVVNLANPKTVQEIPTPLKLRAATGQATLKASAGVVAPLDGVRPSLQGAQLRLTSKTASIASPPPIDISSGKVEQPVPEGVYDVTLVPPEGSDLFAGSLQNVALVDGFDNDLGSLFLVHRESMRRSLDSCDTHADCENGAQCRDGQCQRPPDDVQAFQPCLADGAASELKLVSRMVEPNATDLPPEIRGGAPMCAYHCFTWDGTEDSVQPPLVLCVPLVGGGYRCACIPRGSDFGTSHDEPIVQPPDAGFDPGQGAPDASAGLPGDGTVDPDAGLPPHGGGGIDGIGGTTGSDGASPDGGTAAPGSEGTLFDIGFAPEVFEDSVCSAERDPFITRMLWSKCGFGVTTPMTEGEINCGEGVHCGTHCCPPGSTCTENGCSSEHVPTCPSGYSYCGDSCCPAGWYCADTTTGDCQPEQCWDGRDYCGTTCCEPGTTCDHERSICVSTIPDAGTPVDPPRVMLVVDRSESMLLPPGKLPSDPTAAGTACTSDGSLSGTYDPARMDCKWNILKQSLSTKPLSLRTGLVVFPGPQAGAATCSSPEAVSVAIPAQPDGNNSLIANTLSVQVAPFGGSPAASALGMAASGLPVDLPGKRYIVLITDGLPDCSPLGMQACNQCNDPVSPDCSACFPTDPAATSCTADYQCSDLAALTSQTQQLAAQGIKTTIVAMGARMEDLGMLSEAAGPGGGFFVAASVNELSGALSSIAAMIQMENGGYPGAACVNGACGSGLYCCQGTCFPLTYPCTDPPDAGATDPDGGTGSVCGDGACSSGETCSSCPGDCGACPGGPDGGPAFTDSDGDSIEDTYDNCPGVANPLQDNLDGDSLGDACDPDIDEDGFPNGGDNCPTTSNLDQADADSDGIGDACDAVTVIPPANGWSLAFTGEPTLKSVWGPSGDDLWFGADWGNVLFHWNGSNAQENAGVAIETTRALHGTSSTDIWAVGTNSYETAALHWNGSNWQPTTFSTSRSLSGVYAAGGTAWVIDETWADAAVEQWSAADGWTAVTGVSGSYSAIHGTSASDVWIAGSEVRHWNGSTWETPDSFQTPTTFPTIQYKTVFALQTNDVWFAGLDGDLPMIVHYDGTSFPAEYRVEQGVHEPIIALGATASLGLMAVGASGTIYNLVAGTWQIALQSPGSSYAFEAAYLSDTWIWLVGTENSSGAGVAVRRVTPQY